MKSSKYCWNYGLLLGQRQYICLLIRPKMTYTNPDSKYYWSAITSALLLTEFSAYIAIITINLSTRLKMYSIIEFIIRSIYKMVCRHSTTVWTAKKKLLNINYTNRSDQSNHRAFTLYNNQTILTFGSLNLHSRNRESTKLQHKLHSRPRKLTDPQKPIAQQHKTQNWKRTLITEKYFSLSKKI